jgi:hypothetical protein
MNIADIYLIVALFENTELFEKNAHEPVSFFNFLWNSALSSALCNYFNIPINICLFLNFF